VKLDPRDGQSWHGLGQLLLNRGESAEAIAAFERTIGLHPRNAQAILDLANAMTMAARYDDAANLLNSSLELGDPGIQNDLAWLLATCPDAELRDGPRAVAYAEELCSDPKTCDANYLDTFAAALAARGIGIEIDVDRV